MQWSVDARVPVVFGRPDMAEADDAVLVAGGTSGVGVGAVLRVLPESGPGHAPDCACCRPREPVAALLGGLFLARARGEVPFFRRVVVVTADEAPVRAAILEDPLVSGRFRLG